MERRPATDVFHDWAVRGKDEGMERGHALSVAEMTIDEAEGSASDAKTEETESSSDNQPVTEEPATESEDAPEESTTESTETAKEPEPTPATTTWADDEDPWADN